MEERVSKIYILSRWLRVTNQIHFSGNPPSKETIDLLQKIASKSSDNQVRQACFTAIKRVVKANHQNLSLIASDLYKSLIKQIEKIMQGKSSGLSLIGAGGN